MTPAQITDARLEAELAAIEIADAKLAVASAEQRLARAQARHNTALDKLVNGCHAPTPMKSEEPK